MLTAAHCVTNGAGELVVAPGELGVVLGRHALASDEGQDIPVSRDPGSPKLDSATFDYDITLLRLSEPAQLTATVQTVPLVLPEQRDLYAPGRPSIRDRLGHPAFMAFRTFQAYCIRCRFHW